MEEVSLHLVHVDCQRQLVGHYGKQDAGLGGSLS